MRRQDFELLSSTIRATRERADPSGQLPSLWWHAAIDVLAKNLAAALSRDNAKFDAQRFLIDSGAKPT